MCMGDYKRYASSIHTIVLMCMGALRGPVCNSRLAATIDVRAIRVIINTLILILHRNGLEPS